MVRLLLVFVVVSEDSGEFSAAHMLDEILYRNFHVYDEIWGCLIVFLILWVVGWNCAMTLLFYW